MERSLYLLAAWFAIHDDGGGNRRNKNIFGADKLYGGRRRVNCIPPAGSTSAGR
jgi:hypothetical protein